MDTSFSFPGCNNPSVYGPGLLTVLELCGDGGSVQGIGGTSSEGAVEFIPPRLADEGYYIPCFLVRESQDIPRPALSLKTLHRFVSWGTNEFGTSTAKALATLVQPGDGLFQ